MEPESFQQNKRLRLDGESAEVDHVPPRPDTGTESEHKMGQGFDEQASLEPEGPEGPGTAAGLERAKDEDEGRNNGAGDESEEDSDDENDKLPLSDTRTHSNANANASASANSPRFDFFDGGNHNLFLSEALVALKRWNCRICTTDNLESRKECEVNKWQE